MTTLSDQPVTPTTARWAVRAFDPDHDIKAVVTLIDAIEAHDRVDNGQSEEELRRALDRPHHDARRDRAVVADPADPSRLIGSAVIWHSPGQPAAWVGLRVHPAWRHQGIGRALWTRIYARAVELGAAAIEGDANRRIPAAAAFVRALNGRPVKTSVYMRCPADVPLAAPQVPAGYTIKPYPEVNDPAIVLEALNRGFIGHYGHYDESLEELEHWMAEPTYPPAGLFLAFGPEGTPAGLCWTQVNPDLSARRGTPTGYIDSLGVVPEARRAGLGRALLLTGMHWLRAQGLPTIELDAVGENEMALPLYYGVGFALFQQADTYRWEIA